MGRIYVLGSSVLHGGVVVRVGDLVRTKAPFESEICLVVGIRKDISDECYEVLASRTGKTYNLRTDALEVVSCD